MAYQPTWSVYRAVKIDIKKPMTKQYKNDEIVTLRKTVAPNSPWLTAGISRGITLKGYKTKQLWTPLKVKNGKTPGNWNQDHDQGHGWGNRKLLYLKVTKPVTTPTGWLLGCVIPPFDRLMETNCIIYSDLLTREIRLILIIILRLFVDYGVLSLLGWFTGIRFLA